MRRWNLSTEFRPWAQVSGRMALPLSGCERPRETGRGTVANAPAGDRESSRGSEIHKTSAAASLLKDNSRAGLCCPSGNGFDNTGDGLLRLQLPEKLSWSCHRSTSRCTGDHLANTSDSPSKRSYTLSSFDAVARVSTVRSETKQAGPGRHGRDSYRAMRQPACDTASQEGGGDLRTLMNCDAPGFKSPGVCWNRLSFASVCNHRGIGCGHHSGLAVVMVAGAAVPWPARRSSHYVHSPSGRRRSF